MSERDRNLLKLCTVCGKLGEVMNCARCKSVKYCSVDCQKVDWQHHKRWCNHNVDAKAHQKADSGDPLMPDRFTQWQKRYSEKLSHVTHGMLEDSQLRTHFVHIRVRYVPDTSPYFKIVSAETCTFEQGDQRTPGLGEVIRAQLSDGTDGMTLSGLGMRQGLLCIEEMRGLTGSITPYCLHGLNSRAQLSNPGAIMESINSDVC